MAKSIKPKKEKKPIEPYWNPIVSAYFEFCRAKFNDTPSFEGSQPRDLKNLIQTLHARADAKNVEWTQEVAIARFTHFLEFAYHSNQWLRDNWLLSNLNRQKDAIFFKISQQHNG